MKLDILTIAFTTSIVFITQSIAIFVQYRVNKTYRGIGLWFVGSILLSLGFIFMMALNIKELRLLAILANPFVILGQIFLYLGIIKFIEVSEVRWITVLYYVSFIVLYFSFIFLKNDVLGRSITVSLFSGLISLMTAYKLFHRKGKIISNSENFVTGVLLFYSCFHLLRIFVIFWLPSVNSYVDLEQYQIQVITFLVPIISSILWTFGFVIMVNQRLNLEIFEEKEKLKLVFNTSIDAKLITRMSDGLVIDVNDVFSKLTEYTREEVVGKSILSTNIWENKEDREKYINEFTENELIENKEFSFILKSGRKLVGLLNGNKIHLNGVPYIITSVHDITNRKIAEKEIWESKELYHSILNASPDNITIGDLEGNILMVSPAGKTMFGYSQDTDDTKLDLGILDFLIPQDRERAKKKHEEMFIGKNSGPSEYTGLRLDGSTFFIEVNTNFIFNKEGKPVKMIFSVRDISERKQSEEKIDHLIKQLETERNIAEFNAITDSLTGLPNRRYFDEALRKEFYRVKRSGAPISLIMFDVDYFKRFNDTYGHLAGDSCLRQIGITLKSAIQREYDIVARYGGEEFVVILPETNLEGALLLAEKIRTLIEALEIFHVKSDVSKFITVSLGVVTAYITSLEKPEDLIVKADEAMYKAKNMGRNKNFGIEIL